MRKTFKTQGTLKQWETLIALSLEQMQLDSEVQGNAIYALHKGLQVMKFEITENDGILVNIDYFDERDLLDFRRIAAQIIKNPNAYRPTAKKIEPEVTNEPVNTEEPINDDTHEEDYIVEPSDDTVNPDPIGQEPSVDEPSSGTAIENIAAAPVQSANINDYVRPRPAEPVQPTDQPVQKKSKALPIVLITLGVLIVLFVGAFFGYRYYKQKQIPAKLLAEVVDNYNSGNYDAAITTANTLINEYPNSDQAYSAQTIKDNAQAEVDRLAKEAELQARLGAAKSMFNITSKTMTGPDEDGDVHLFFGYTNLYSSDITSVTFGVTFLDSTGAVALTEFEGTEVVYCIDDQGLAAGTALSTDSIVNFGPYRNAGITGYNLVSLEVTYADETVLSLGSIDDISYITVQ